jgi:hypothetical protein
MNIPPKTCQPPKPVDNPTPLTKQTIILSFKLGALVLPN